MQYKLTLKMNSSQAPYTLQTLIIIIISQLRQQWGHPIAGAQAILMGQT
jgi:hypothetical protein